MPKNAHNASRKGTTLIDGRGVDVGRSHWTDIQGLCTGDAEVGTAPYSVQGEPWWRSAGMTRKLSAMTARGRLAAVPGYCGQGI